MAATCSECGKEVSTKAQTCPHCGAKREKVGIMLIKVGCGVIILVPLGIAMIFFLLSLIR